MVAPSPPRSTLIPMKHILNNPVVLHFARLVVKGMLLLLLPGMPLQIKAEETRQSIAETVNQGLMDLRSGLAEKRRGSIMLLAKYPQHPSALPAIIKALEDDEASVRRAAVVSLGENINVLTPLQASQLAATLMDPDPEVRLTGSAWLPQLVLRSSTYPTLRPTTLPKAAEPEVRERLVGGVTAGLKDPEPLIRLKSVEALQYLRWPIPNQQVIPLLGDPDSRVRLQAHQSLFSKLPVTTYLAEATRLHPDESPAVRLVLAETLSRRPMPDSIPLLRLLAEDSVSSIQLQAAVGLFNADPESGLPQILFETLMGPNPDSGNTFRIFNTINRLPINKRKPLVQPLLTAESPIVRSQAVMRWLQWNPGGIPTGMVKSFLMDPTREVRQMAVRHFMRQPAQLDKTVAMELGENPFEDVRRQAIALSAGLGAEEQGTLATRLLFDTVPAIRSQAIGLIVQLRPPNWDRILKASLRDPSPEVYRVAALALLEQSGPEGLQIATEFVRDYPDAEISSLIRMRLGTQ